jgi:hypothetical protein
MFGRGPRCDTSSTDRTITGAERDVKTALSSRCRRCWRSRLFGQGLGDIARLTLGMAKNEVDVEWRGVRALRR